jgi:hypothetical protein
MATKLPLGGGAHGKAPGCSGCSGDAQSRGWRCRTPFVIHDLWQARQAVNTAHVQPVAAFA